MTHVSSDVQACHFVRTIYGPLSRLGGGVCIQLLVTADGCTLGEHELQTPHLSLQPTLNGAGPPPHLMTERVARTPFRVAIAMRRLR